MIQFHRSNEGALSYCNICGDKTRCWLFSLKLAKVECGNKHRLLSLSVEARCALSHSSLRPLQVLNSLGRTQSPCQAQAGHC